MSKSSLNTVSLSEADRRRVRRVVAAADLAGVPQPLQRALIHRRGWMRMLAPRAAGGMELALPAVVRLEEEIASLDGSLAWVATLCAGAGWFTGFLPPDLAREIVATPRLCIAGSGAPTGFADRDGDGYRLTGRWDYASGAPMATHFTLNAVLREHGETVVDDAGAARIRAFIVPARHVQIVPTWGSIGLRATASHSYAIDGQWVPSSHGFIIDAACATADGPLYRFPFMSLAFVTLTANLAGMAAHFIDLAQAVIAKRRQAVTGIPLGDVPEVAARLRQARHDLGAARAHFYELLDRAWELVAGGEAVCAADALAIQSASLTLVQAARLPVDGLYPYCGLQAAHELSDINRVWRDFHTATQHALLLPQP
ncbi:MAG: acyl-CoA dehydrogenase [Pseudomonadota bacterium]